MAHNEVKSNNYTVSYAVNVTAVESQSMHSRSHDGDFEWTALDDPSEMTYEPQYPFWLTFEDCLLFCLLVPIIFLVFPEHHCEYVREVKSQKIIITDTHVIYRRSLTRCCRSYPYIHCIDLNNIRSIENIFMETTRQFELRLYESDYTWCRIEMIGFNESSETPEIITDTIIQRRLKRAQTTCYTIPRITSSSKYNTICLNPDTLTIDYKETEGEPSGAYLYGYGTRTEITAFLDSLGSIDKNSTTLSFWSPPVGRPRRESGDAPEMTAYFPDDTSCTEFKIAAERSRDSFKLDNS